MSRKREAMFYPTLKLVSVIAVLTAVSLSRNFTTGLACLAIPAAVVWILIERPRFLNLARRIAALLPFIAAVAVFGIHGTTGGVRSIILRGTVSGVFLALLGETTPFYTILGAMRRLRVPGAMVLILSFTYRYLDLIVKEGKRLERARNLRFFGRGCRGQSAVLGSIIGSLFVRSYERADRVYTAMVLRGYSRDAAADITDLGANKPYSLPLNILFALVTAASALSIGVSSIWHF